MTDADQLTLQEAQRRIDNMSHEQLCRHWRFAPLGDPLIQGQAGSYFTERLFTQLGGFTPEISKRIGF